MRRNTLAVNLVWCTVVATNFVMVWYYDVRHPLWVDLVLLCGSVLYLGWAFGVCQCLRGTWIERCWNGIVRVVSGTLEAIVRGALAVLGAKP